MRRLSKHDKPEVLQVNADRWKQEYLSALQQRTMGGISGALPNRYTHAQIRNALALETSKKCAYCESSIDQVSYPHVEHIRPKSKFPELVVEWGNLTVGCEQCNTHKGDYYNEIEPILNPYEDEPGEHLIFAGSMVRQRPGDELGERSILRLKLYRAALTAAREERLNAVADAVDRWATATGQRKEMLEGAIREDALRGQYSAAVAAYLQIQGFPLTSSAEVPAEC